MGDSDRAIEILIEAEGALSALMRDGLEHQRYDGVAVVADIAQRFSNFIRSLEGPPSKTLKAVNRTRRQPKKKRSAKDATRTGTRGSAGVERARYPKFRRDGDRLVKVGWSRKSRQEYEHRAPSNVVWTFAARLRDRNEAGPFTMDSILPLVDDAGTEIPSYQAYIALAWLRKGGVVAKNGRDGYRANPERLDEESVRALWEAVPPLGSDRSEEAEVE